MPNVGAKLWSRGGTFMRYAAGSVVAFGCSEVVLMVSFGLFGTRAWTAASLAWLAGAVPNYLLNRRWAWKRRGPAQFLRETLPYWAITLSTAVMAIGATSLADGWVRDSVTGRGEQSLLLGAVYLAAYGVVFTVKFVLFDKLVFSARQSAVVPTSAPSAAAPSAPVASTVAPAAAAPSATGR